MDRHPPIRLLLADAHALTRSALGCLLTGRPGFALVGEASTLTQCLGLASQTAPDVILLHPRTEGGLGVDAIPTLLLAARAEARLLLLAETADPDLHRRAVRLGRTASSARTGRSRRCSRPSRRCTRAKCGWNVV